MLMYPVSPAYQVVIFLGHILQPVCPENVPPESAAATAAAYHPNVSCVQPARFSFHLLGLTLTDPGGLCSCPVLATKVFSARPAQPNRDRRAYDPMAVRPRACVLQPFDRASCRLLLFVRAVRGQESSRLAAGAVRAEGD